MLEESGHQSGWLARLFSAARNAVSLNRALLPTDGTRPRRKLLAYMGLTLVSMTILMTQLLEVSSLGHRYMWVYTAAVVIVFQSRIELTKGTYYSLVNVLIATGVVTLDPHDGMMFALATAILCGIVNTEASGSWYEAFDAAVDMLLMISIGIAINWATLTFISADGFWQLLVSLLAVELGFRVFAYVHYPIQSVHKRKDPVDWRKESRQFFQQYEIIESAVLAPLSLIVITATSMVPWIPAFAVAPVLAMSLVSRRASKLYETENALEQAIERAGTDSLTGLANRHRFNELAMQAVASGVRYGHRIAVIMADLDDFKAINDTHGHLVGDDVLVTAAQALKSAASRKSDVVARFGGEEFVVLTHYVDEADVRLLAEKIRVHVEHALAKHGSTISLGVAYLGSDDKQVNLDEIGSDSSSSVATAIVEAATTLEHLIHHADEALYSAKRTGKNRVVEWLNTGDLAA